MEFQLSASVSRAVGTACWVTATVAIRVGAIAIPLSASNPATTAGRSTNGNGTKDTASATAPIRRRRDGVACQ